MLRIAAIEKAVPEAVYAASFRSLRAKYADYRWF
jgi:hypothetical protein